VSPIVFNVSILTAVILQGSEKGTIAKHL
jgi:hypothetical protein